MFQFVVWGWAGLLIGVSFIATPAKFLAPSVSLQQALDVGRSTFFVLKWVECVLALILVGLLLSGVHSLHSRALCALVFVLLAAQYIGLLPVLDARVELILQGEVIGKSGLHYLYIGLELLKIGCLVLAGFFIARS